MGFIKTLIGLPILIVLLIFAFVNNDLATFSLWPFEIEITISWSVAILFFVIFGFLLGEFFAWMSYAPLRKDLRRQKKDNKKLTEKVSGLQDDLDQIKAEKENPQPEIKSGLFGFFKKKEDEPAVNNTEDGIF